MRHLRTAIGVLGELAITAGVVLLLFVVWQLGYVGVVEGAKQSDAVAALEGEFNAGRPAGPAGPASATTGPTPTSAAPTPTSAAPTPGTPPADLPTGTAFAILRIPRLGGPTWAKPVYQGVGLDVLAQGIGHYPQTQLPGQVGNTALAGHRAGHGNPLIDIDRIRVGDVMIIETQDASFVYRVTGHEIVPPTSVQVLDPVPDQPGATATTATTAQFTLTTCDPRYGSTNRYIVFSVLEQAIPRSQGLPASLLADPGEQA